MNTLRFVIVATALAAGACTDDLVDDEIAATDLPPGAASAPKGDGQLIDVVANHCEVFVDRVVTFRSSHALYGVVMYLKTLNGRLDGDVAEVTYFAKLGTQNGTHCGDTSACQFEGQWHAYRANAFVDASDYWTLSFTLSHDFTSPLVFEGAFFVRSTTGKTYWVNPAGGGNFFVDVNMANNVENVLGGFSFDRGTGPENAAVTADIFPYLNPRRCR